MSLTPDLNVTQDIETSRTYKLSENGFQGSTDNLEALQQAIYKILNTERYEYPIYSFFYGIQLEDLIGKNPDYVKAELKRRIVECLLSDERITDVRNFKYTITADNMFCTFDVHSIYGTTTISKEVTINV
ncbi:MAG: Phage-like element protein XkdS [Herbinix sp.]|jgi:hypothetical protein|nr:Phage-like element protein XkdS [Herbinix sp.]